jgi:hypothetical protein
MNRHVSSITGRLSLRPPQRRSLEILARVCEIVPPTVAISRDEALAAIQAEYPSVMDFERDFPSLCFALATGVGKTRLMGAFVTYLYQVHNVRNFFVLAPNLTIYNKLITDFTPKTPKYVFTGITDFAINPPVLITGDNYESQARTLYDQPDDCKINIFNIAKITSEVRGGKSPRIKRLSEYIGESYFAYLSKLNDLVMLMDESHRYTVEVRRGFTELRPSAYTANAQDGILHFRQPPKQKSKIAQFLYTGFERCLYRLTKFQSNTERMLAIILERGADRLRSTLQLENDLCRTLYRRMGIPARRLHFRTLKRRRQLGQECPRYIACHES